MWPRVDGMRTIEFGSPGTSRSWLTGLVVEGRKRATAGILQEYETEDEPLEEVGERLAVLDDESQHVATVEVTRVRRYRFTDVPWEFAAAEGEGDRDLDEWRAGHRRYWTEAGTPVDDDTEVVCLWFRLA